MCVHLRVYTSSLDDLPNDLEQEDLGDPPTCSPASSRSRLHWPAPCPLRSVPCAGASLCHVSCWLRCYPGFLDYFRGWLDFPFFFFIHCLVTRSFTFCLNFVCLSLSPGLCPVCLRCCADCPRCSFPAASSIHQVQAADLRRVSAPPGSFTM